MPDAAVIAAHRPALPYRDTHGNTVDILNGRVLVHFAVGALPVLDALDFSAALARAVTHVAEQRTGGNPNHTTPAEEVTMIDTSTYADTITAGADWLDTNQPGWLAKVEADAIESWHPFNSVLGQVYGDDHNAPLSKAERERYGFWLPGDKDANSHDEMVARLAAWEPLSIAWTELIEARQMAVGGAL